MTQGVDDLANELGSHFRAEDEELFALFAVPAPADGSAAFKPQLTTPAGP